MDESKLDLLILARISMPSARPNAVALRRSLEPYVVPPIARARWPAVFSERVDALRAKGWVDGLALTPGGRAQMKAVFGKPALRWREARPYLAAVALGEDPQDAEILRTLASADGLTATVLDHEYALNLDHPTLSLVIDHLAHRQLTGRPGKLTLDAARAAALAQALGSTSSAGPERLARALAARTTGAGDLEPTSLVTGLTRKWLEADDAPAELGPEAFAARVLMAASAVPKAGRWGDSNVFISAVWRTLAEDPPFAAMGRERFKERLCEANRAGMLVLHRADLVGAMDRREVAESESRYLNATFHFIEAAPKR